MSRLSSSPTALDTAMKAVTWMSSWVALVVTGLVLIVLTARGPPGGPGAAARRRRLGGGVGRGGIGQARRRAGRPPEALWLVRAHGWSWPSATRRRRFVPRVHTVKFDPNCSLGREALHAGRLPERLCALTSAFLQRASDKTQLSSD